MLNENPHPNHSDKIDTTNTYPNFDVVWVAPNKKSAKIDIIDNVAWPNGLIVLFKK
jgi:hypothetical protein